MPKFICKEPVEAVQWFPGVEIEELHYQPLPVFHYSLDEKMFYVVLGDLSPRGWLEVEKHTYPGPVSVELKDGPGILRQIKRTDTQEVYYRKYLSFAFWHVKSGREFLYDWKKSPDGVLTELFFDYACVEGWSRETLEAQEKKAWFRLDNKNVYVHAGDWVVQSDRGLQIYSPESFEKLFTPVK